MEASIRPATGYPDPNPNRYVANPPPAAADFPYFAAGPPTNSAYYSNQNNPYYPQNYHPGPNTLRRALALLIGLVLIFAAVTFIVWLVLRPQLPQFRVDSLSISDFRLGNDSLLSFAAEVRLTARNPNKKMALSYDDIEAAVYYKSWSLSDTMVPPFSQGKENVTSLKANFAAAGSFVDKPAVDGINSERRSDGVVGFDLRMLSRVSFKAKAWRIRRRFFKVFCGDLGVRIPTNGRSATSIGGPRRCRVGT